MNTAAASTVTIGQDVATIPSRESGLRTVLAGTVVDVEAYDILGRSFVDIRLLRSELTFMTLTMSADSVLEVL